MAVTEKLRHVFTVVDLPTGMVQVTAQLSSPAWGSISAERVGVEVSQEQVNYVWDHLMSLHRAASAKEYFGKLSDIQQLGWKVSYRPLLSRPSTWIIWLLFQRDIRLYHLMEG